MDVYFYLCTYNEIKHQCSHKLMNEHTYFCYLENFVLLALINLSCQTTMSQSILDDVFVRLGTGLLVQLWS